MLRQRTYYSTGGGFIASAEQLARPAQDDVISSGRTAPHPFTSAAQLLAQCDAHGLSIAAVVLANEALFRTPKDTQSGLDGIAATMNACIERGLRQRNGAFLKESSGNASFRQELFYTVVSCGGRENGEYDVFCGKTPAGEAGMEGFDAFTVPGGWYVDFSYHGDMFDISDVFIDDLYKWIMVKEVEINPNCVGMLNIYRNDYWKDSAVRMLVPIVKPV